MRALCTPFEGSSPSAPQKCSEDAGVVGCVTRLGPTARPWPPWHWGGHRRPATPPRYTSGPRARTDTIPLHGCPLARLAQVGALAYHQSMPKILWTREQARQMSAKGHEARRRQRAARRMAQAALVAPPPTDPNAPDPYLQARLLRVREQLCRLDEMLLSECDPQKLDRLASATSKLSEVERLLAQRPAPGSYRPTTARKRTGAFAQVIPE